MYSFIVLDILLCRDFILFFQDIHVLMDGIEELIKNVTINFLKYQAEDLKSFSKSAKVEDRTEILRNMVSLGFHRITFTEACQMLSDAGQFDKVVDDFSREHELYLCKKLGERSNIRIDN